MVETLLFENNYDRNYRLHPVNRFPETPYVTDWLGSNAVFYDLTTSRAGTSINLLLEGLEVKPDPIGVSNFLKYGFNVYGRTVVANIRMTEPNSVLYRKLNGELEYKNLEDPIETLINRESNVEQLDRMLAEWFEREVPQNSESGINYILPLSGGYDSAMLGWYLKKRSDVTSFTYGISWFQGRSYEVVNARQTAETLGIKWEQIYLGNFHSFTEMQIELYGSTMHAHSMYHFEFYTKILESLLPGRYEIISGIYGDLWAGSWEFAAPINSGTDLTQLAIRHGLYSERLLHQFRLKHPGVDFAFDENEFFRKNQTALANHKFRIITAARMKMSLIRHLIDTPSHFGMQVKSPFLDIEIAMCMVNLSPELRTKRKWQSDFLNERGILPKKRAFTSYGNTLDFYASYRNPIRLSISDNQADIFPDLDLGKLQHNARVSRKLVALKLLNDHLFRYFKFSLGLKLLKSQQKSYNELVLLAPLLKIFSRLNF